MTEEQVNYHRAADAVAKMTEQLLMLKMQMPVNLAVALQATASSLDVVQAELNRWQARLEEPADIGTEWEVSCEYSSEARAVAHAIRKNSDCRRPRRQPTAPVEGPR